MQKNTTPQNTSNIPGGMLSIFYSSCLWWWAPTCRRGNFRKCLEEVFIQPDHGQADINCIIHQDLFTQSGWGGKKSFLPFTSLFLVFLGFVLHTCKESNSLLLPLPFQKQSTEEQLTTWLDISLWYWCKSSVVHLHWTQQCCSCPLPAPHSSDDWQHSGYCSCPLPAPRSSDDWQHSGKAIYKLVTRIFWQVSKQTL